MWAHTCLFTGNTTPRLHVQTLRNEQDGNLLFLRAAVKDKRHLDFQHSSVQFSSFQSLSHVRLFASPWTAARQASLSITNFRSLLKLMSIELVMPSNHLILCRPLLLPPSIFPSIRVFFNESVLRTRWPKYWSFSFSISPSNEHSGLISFRMDWLDWLDSLQSKGLLKVFANSTV